MKSIRVPSRHKIAKIDKKSRGHPVATVCFSSLVPSRHKIAKIDRKSRGHPVATVCFSSSFSSKTAELINFLSYVGMAASWSMNFDYTIYLLFT